MGGDTVSVPSSTINDGDDDLSTTVPEFPHHHSEIPSLRDYSKTLEREANVKRFSSAYAEVIKSYDDMKDRVENMEVAKSKVLSYTPGSWVKNIGGMMVRDYNVPKTTTILLIGPKGSGKSSLVNRISRVFEDDKFAPERAQVAYNSSIRDGTCFLQEYMIPRNSTSFCFYDTCGFFDDSSVNEEMIEHWMRKGVRHGELVNIASLLTGVKCESRQDELSTYERRRVDYVIFVVNGLSVLKCLESNGADTQYMRMVTEVFSSPILSFKDHKPAIAITHGDLLSISERARVRVCLGNLLGVHPIKQTFDIPDNHEPTTELAIIDLVRYALEHADRNLPRKSRPTISKDYTSTVLPWAHLLLLLAVGLFMFTVHLHGFCSLKLHPTSVPDPNLEIKKVMEFDQETVLPDLEIKKVMEFHQETVPEPDLEIKNVMEFDQESVPEPILEIKEVMKFDQESVPEPSPETKKVMEFDQESVPEPSLETKKVMEFDQESVPEPSLETKKVMEFDQESVPEPSLETEKDMDIDQETVPEPSLEMKKVTEIDPNVIPEHIMKIEKVISGSTPKPSKKTKKAAAERTLGKRQKMKKVAAPLKIDWKKIRHIW